jgi:DNA-directed RNA polymerase subunit RPC12/RpoP
MAEYEYKCYECDWTGTKPFRAKSIKCERCGDVAMRKFSAVPCHFPTRIDDAIEETGVSPYDGQRSRMIPI